MGLIDIIGDPRFVNFLSTFGLAVVLVLYFVFVRDPKQAGYWQERYKKLIDNYDILSETYTRLREDLKPETRKCTSDQAKRLASIGLDRDLYKLYYYMCGKLEDKRPESIATFITESIRDTNDVWSEFISPFPRVEHIGDLYEIYTKNGESLKQKLEEIVQENIPTEKKKSQVLNLLFENTENMKTDFQGFIKDLAKGKEIKPYHERAVTAKR